MLATVFTKYCQSANCHTEQIYYKKSYSSFNRGTSQPLKKLSMKINCTFTYMYIKFQMNKL